jgi:hypothetical protein
MREVAMSPRYRVTLTLEERQELESMTRRGKTHARRFIHARALLLCDAGADGPAWNVSDVATALGVTSRAIEHLHYTPKHGSWLNMAEIELSVLKGQCLDRRIPDMETMQTEVAAWERGRNNSARKIVWQFTTPDARIKLKRLYPNI